MTRIDMNPGGGNAVEVRGLVKHYGETKALDGVDLDGREGTVLGVLGPNGAGKTTLVRCLSTLVAPDAGRASSWSAWVMWSAWVVPSTKMRTRPLSLAPDRCRTAGTRAQPRHVLPTSPVRSIRTSPPSPTSSPSPSHAQEPRP